MMKSYKISEKLSKNLDFLLSTSRYQAVPKKMFSDPEAEKLIGYTYAIQGDKITKGYIKCLDRETTTASFKPVSSDFGCYIYNDYISSQQKILLAFSTIKITNFEESSHLFGYKPTKKMMYELSQQGLMFNGINIIENYPCKKDGVNRDIVEVYYKGRSLKFITDEVEFVEIDLDKLFNLKGFKPKKDRSLSIGKEIRFVNNKHLPVEHKSKGIIVGSEKLNNKTLFHVKTQVLNKFGLVSSESIIRVEKKNIRVI